MQNTNSRPGSKPAVHNQRKPFNPNKFGILWNSLSTTLMKGIKAKQPIGEANQPIICILNIGNKKFELTHSETNRMVEVMIDAQIIYKNAFRLGMLDSTSGTPESISNL